MSRAAVIIPTWNNSELTVRCLESLSRFTANYHLIWIDNGSTETDKAVVLATIKRLGMSYQSWFNSENLGFPKAINQGLKIALADDYDPIVLLNNDVRLTAGWLDKLRAALDSDKTLGLVGALHQKGTQSYMHFAADVGFREGDPEAYFNSGPLKVKYSSMCVPFSCVAIRRGVINTVGLLDETFSPCLGEDNDYCDRVRIAGWRTGYCLNCFTWHEHRATVRNLPGYRIIKRRNERYLQKKRYARNLGLI